MALLEQHIFGTNNEGADSPSGTAGAPALYDEWVTFDGDDGYYFGTSLDESGIEARVVFRIEEDLSAIDGARCIWKSGGYSNGIGLGIAEDPTGAKPGYFFGVFAQSSGADTQIMVDLGNLSQNVWYEAFLSGSKLTVRELDTPANGFTKSGTVTAANGGVAESIGYAYSQSPLTSTASTGEYFIGSVRQVDVYEDGTMTWPSDLDPPVYSAIDVYLFGSSYDGKVLPNEEGTVTLNSDNVEFDGTNGLRASASWGDEAILAARIVFSADSFSGTQTFWKSGGYVNGISFGIHDGGVGIFGRASSLTSITVSASLLSTGTKYVLYADQGKVAIYDETVTTLIGEATGSVTAGDGTAIESVGYAFDQCPITAATSDTSFFDGKIYEIELWLDGELSFPDLSSGTTTEPDTGAEAIGLDESIVASLEPTRGATSGLGLGGEAGGAFSGQGSIDAGLGLGESVGRNVIITRGVVAGLGLGEAANNTQTFEAGAVAGLGLTGGALSSISVTRGNLAGIGFSEISGSFNYSAWLRENKHLATYRYYGLLTGTADGLADCQLSGLKSIQFRMRSATASYLSLVLVHDTDLLAAISERQGGEIVVDMVAVVDGVESLREELIRAPFFSVRYDKGPKSRSITLVGYVDLANVGGNRVALEGVTKETMLADGLMQYRCARPDFYLRPGDTAVHGDSEFVVDSISSLVSPTSQYMDVSE